MYRDCNDFITVGRLPIQETTAPFIDVVEQANIFAEPCIVLRCDATPAVHANEPRETITHGISDKSGVPHIQLSHLLTGR